MAWAKSWGMKSQFCSRILSGRVRLHKRRVEVVPVLVWGCVAWHLCKETIPAEMTPAAKLARVAPPSPAGGPSPVDQGLWGRSRPSYLGECGRCGRQVGDPPRLLGCKQSPSLAFHGRCGPLVLHRGGGGGVGAWSCRPAWNPRKRWEDLWIRAFGVSWSGSTQGGHQIHIAASLLRMLTPVGACAGGAAADGWDWTRRPRRAHLSEFHARMIPCPYVRLLFASTPHRVSSTLVADSANAQTLSIAQL